jgi:hypothetical protein
MVNRKPEGRYFWLGLGCAQTASNTLPFIDSTLRHPGCKMVGLYGKVLAIGASWRHNRCCNALILSFPRRRRAWFNGLRNNMGHPSQIRLAA